MKQFSVINNWMIRLDFQKNDTPELILRKNFFLISNFIALFFISFIAILAHLLALKHLTVHILMLLALTLIQTILLFMIPKWSKWFIYTVFSLYLVLIFYIIISLGGIANSAGLLMLAYFFLLTAQWMRDITLLFFVGVLYVIGVLIAGIAYPYLQIDENLSGWKNNLFFAINFGWIGLLIALALYSTILKDEDAANKRVIQLQELELLKSNIYANIANEFLPSLTLIKGNAEEIGEGQAGEISHMKKSIIQNSDRILFLVNQMLNLSKVEAGDIPMHHVQTDLVAFVGRITESFKDYADFRDLALHFQSECPHVMMDIDLEKLEESLSNLLSNAIKYTPGGGQVDVTIRMPEPIKALARQVEISVRDTGIGIPEDQLDKIFIRFYRIQDNRFPYQEGTGIGLTLVNEYLRMMNGSIRVNSTLNVGSEFIVTLPVTQDAVVADVVQAKGIYAPLKAVRALPQEINSGDKIDPRLLIIEDNKELIEYLIGLLRSDYKILTAENGILGVEQAIGHIPDIILSDVMMPGKDGFQVCKELKEDIRTNHIPIVLLTARADTDSRITGLECGADAYLIKPFDKKELKICLHNLFVQREKLRLKYQSNLYEKLPEEMAAKLNDRFLDKTIKILEQNYGNDQFRIEDLYMKLGVSRVQLHRKLTALTGQSTSNFIRNFRLQKACHMLFETNKNVSEIAYAVGFADSNYFTRAFTQEHGMSPTEFRKSIV